MKTIKLFATLRDVAGKKEIEVPFHDGETVRELVETMNTVCPALKGKIVDETGELTGFVHIIVHGRNIQWLNGLETTIRATDTLVLMPPTAGG